MDKNCSTLLGDCFPFFAAKGIQSRINTDGNGFVRSSGFLVSPESDEGGSRLGLPRHSKTKPDRVNAELQTRNSPLCNCWLLR
jgi:hypothetical protein